MDTTPKNLASPSKRKQTTSHKTICRLFGIKGFLLLVLLVGWCVTRLPRSKKAPKSIEVDTYTLFSLAKKGQYLRHTGAAASEWRTCFQEILAACDRQFPIADDEEEILLYRYQGLAQEVLGNSKAAKNAFKASIDLLKTDEPQNDLALPQVLEAKAQRLGSKDDDKGKIVWYDYAAWLYQREGSNQSQKKRIALLQDIVRASNHGSNDRLHVLEELLAIYQQDAAKYQTEITAVLREQGYCYCCLKTYRAAIDRYGKAIAIYQNQLKQVTGKEAQQEIQQAIAAVTADKGTAYQYWKKYKDAAAQYDKAIAIYQKFGGNQYKCKQAIATITKKMMQMHAEQAQYKQALTVLSKLETLYEELASTPFTCPEWLKGEKGQGRLLENYKNSHERAQAAYRHFKVYLLATRAHYYKELGKYQAAIDSYNAMTNHLKKFPEKAGYNGQWPQQFIVSALQGQARIYEAWGKYTKAIELLKEAKKLLEELGPALYIPPPITGYTLAKKIADLDYHISELEEKK